MRPDRPPQERKVALLVDYGGLVDSREVSPEGLARRASTFASSLGRLKFAAVYADWTEHAEAARIFRRNGIEPRLVLPLESGDDRGDLVLALDALGAALTMPAVGIFVIASADAGLQELIVRLRRLDREVIVCGPRQTMFQELTRVADRFVALDLTGSPGPAPAASTETGAVTPHVNFADYDWRRFLRLLDELEKRLNFVGLKYLNHKVLNRENCGFEDRGRRQALLNHAIDEGIIEIYQIDNIEAGGDPVSACRLGRNHAVVRKHLGDPPAVVAEKPAPG